MAAARRKGGGSGTMGARRGGLIRPITTICLAFLAACGPQLAAGLGGRTRGGRARGGDEAWGPMTREERAAERARAKERRREKEEQGRWPRLLHPNEHVLDDGEDESSSSARRLEIAVTNSDEFATAVLEARVPRTFGIGFHDHARITETLATTKEMIDAARTLVENPRTVREGRAMMERANNMFRQVKEHIMRQHEFQRQGVTVPEASEGRTQAEPQPKPEGPRDDVQRRETASDQEQAQGETETAKVASVPSEEEIERSLLQKRYSGHDVQMAEEDERRAVDIARRIYETMVTFPDCVEKLFEECLAIINADLGRLGLSTIEVVVRDKRNISQEGYNKVVIITNELADRVTGRAGDGIVSYPFMWNDAQVGQRTLGVDGKWNCHDMTPEECCNIIKQGVPGQDMQGSHIECHIFVPFGGVGNPRRSDRVFIKLSPDGRVHEPPIIQ